MVELAHYLLIGICVFIVMWAMIKVERVYQFPFFMASMVITFILPQVSALINNPGLVTESMLFQVLIMACLCLSMCWFGYNRPPNRKLLSKLQISLNNKKLLHSAIFLTAIGWIFGILTRQAAITLEQGTQWSGSVTIFLFFQQVIYIGFAIFLVHFLKKPSVINIVGTIIAGFPIIQTILAGRRQPTMTFLMIIGFCVWFMLRLAPPRWLVLIVLIAGIYIIPVVGQLRHGFWDLIFQQDWQNLKLSAEDSFDALQSGTILELRNAALVMHLATSSGNYEYGAGYWNALIFQYIPGQIIGYDFKDALQFNLQRESNLSQDGYAFPIGTTWTGIGDSYLQFGYFGCLIFALMGVLFKTLWVSSIYQGSIVAALLFMSLISPAMVGITHGTERFFQELIFQVIVITLVTYYARSSVKRQKNFKVHKIN